MNRRSFIRGAAALLAYLGCSCAPITYEIAKDQPDRRQEYIDEMVRKFPPPSNVVSIKYTKEDYYQNPHDIDLMQVMRTKLNIPSDYSLHGRIIKEPIKTEIMVYGEAFGLSEDEMISVLVDHEYFHSDMAAGDVKISISKSAYPEIIRILDPTKDLFEIFQELEAYTNQASNFSKRNLSCRFKQRICGAYDRYREMLSTFQETPIVYWMKTKYPSVDCGTC